MLEIIRKNLAACASSNWDDYRATLSTEAVYEEVSSRRRVVGAERFIIAVRRWKIAFPDLKAVVSRAYTVGDRVIAEVEWEGTHTGTLEGSFGILAPTNRRCGVSGAILFTIKSDKIAELRTYFDVMTVLTQLGAYANTAMNAAARSDSMRP